MNIPVIFYSVIPMNAIAESVSLKKLPVLATIREAVDVSWRHRAMLIRWIIGCTIGTGIICSLQEYLAVNYEWVQNGWNPVLASAFLTCLAAMPTLMISVLFSVFCYRLMLVKNEWESVKRITFTKREWRFLGWMLSWYGALVVIVFFGLIAQKLGLAFVRDFQESVENLVFLKLFLETYFVEVFMWILGSYLFARYCLIFPATAVDLKPSLAWSSKQTKENEWRLALLFGGLSLVFGFLYCPPSLLTWLQIDQWMIVKHVIRPFLIYLVTPIEVAALAIAFRELTNWTPTSQFPESIQHWFL